MILAARSLGALLLIVFLHAMYVVFRGDFDPNDTNAPLEIWRGIMPLLAFLVLAWWLLFR